ncbi:MAG: RluA family pseudouridine synthase [Isosphaeraceae bacterium]
MNILYEDAHCLAVSKPGGLLTQGVAGGEPTLERAVRLHLRPDDPGAVYVGTVHRLDRVVSGVVLWAKTPKAARRLARQFAERVVSKEYWAIVSGTPQSAEGTWDDWLYEHETGLGVVQICQGGTPRARRALTRFRHEVDAEGVPFGCVWLRLWPETGRTHQLRVQAGARGLPVLGDRAYGSVEPFPIGIALHARALTVQHPTLDRPIRFEAPLPDTWEERGIRLPGIKDSPRGVEGPGKTHKEN